MKKLDIIYEDKFIIVVNKPNNYLTISTPNKYENNLYEEVSSYVKKQHKSNKIFIVHRLDKDTSGLVLFAKNEQIKEKLQDNWDNTKRLYYAIVNGVVEKDKGIIESYLKETKTYLVYSTNSKDGKLAITEYEKIVSNNKYSLLRINIRTGRKNQIRVHLNDIGHSIVGDKKYGINNYRRLCLHAYYLEFMHPVTKKIMSLETKYPESFKKLIDYKN